jgi:tetratricopeptide (TPR) repeat protein
MRSIVLLFAFLFSTFARAQNKVDTIMQKAACDCFSKIFENSTQNGNSFSACFLKSIGKDTVLIKNECKRLYGDTTAESFYKFGTDYFNRNVVNLVYTCDTYFKMMDSIRYAQMNSLSKDSIRASITSLNLTDSNTWNKDFLVARGAFYFALADYSNAQKNLDAALAIDSSSVQALFFKAWIFEIKKDYDSAIKLYTYLANLTKKNNYNIFAAIAKRKKGSL